MDDISGETIIRDIININSHVGLVFGKKKLGRYIGETVSRGMTVTCAAEVLTLTGL